MAGITYLDFDLSLERAEDGYCARVLRSPCGEAQHRFQRPLSDIELRDFGSGVVRHRQGVRGVDIGEIERVKRYGARLFDTVFGGEVQTCLVSSLHQARGRGGTGLRIRLRLSGAPELAELPWEYLYRTAKREFLALTMTTPVVRYLDLGEAARPVMVRPPLRILVMISSPSDAEPLDVDVEWENLRTALAPLEQRGQVVVHRLESATLDALRWKLRDEEYHVFHYIGHAGFDPYTRRGVLLLEDDQGRSATTSAEQLGVVLFEEDTLRLAVLNACEGARTSGDDIFAGTAQTLVQKDVPAVVAMQFAISDGAAVVFARDFYRSLAFGDPVDSAVTQARQAIFSRDELEWGTPVLYMRAPDGRLFDVQSRAVPRPSGGSAAPPPPSRASRETARPPSVVQPLFKAPPDAPLQAPPQLTVQTPVQTAPPATPPVPAPAPAAAPDQAALLERAKRALEAEEWDRAIDTLNQVVARFGGNPDVFALLRSAEQQRELTNLYAVGVRQEAAGAWREAVSCYARVRLMAPGRFHDLDERFRRTQRLAAAAVVEEEERAERAEREQAERERAAQAERERAARAERERADQAVAQEAARQAALQDARTAAEARHRRRKRRIVAGVLGVAVLGMLVGIGLYRSQVPSRDAEMLKQGFAPFGAAVSGSLGAGGEHSYTFALVADTEYRIAASCDRDCGDLDLALLSDDGKSIVEDYAPDALPMLDVRPASNGIVTLNVRMSSCSAAPCSYAYRLYTRTSARE